MRRHRQPIGIVGMGCRLPGGISGVQNFWEFLLRGGDAICEVPPDRWNLERHFAPGVLGKVATTRGGFLDDVRGFDAGYFGISPREAQHMDPQQRLLLEVCVEALADAGLPLAGLKGSRTGVFIGASARDYERLGDAQTVGTHSATGAAASILSNRLSYLFDLRGPSFTVDTACSSSLYAVHLALQSLWDQECDIALVGGVNLMLHLGTFASFSALSMLSQDGLCRAFDAKGTGFVRSEGAGVLVLRRLDDNVRGDGERIYATILGSGVNQDGMSQGMTVPSQSAQESLLREVYSRAGLQASQVRYVEAHGTGTPVGDPIEARALGEVLGRGREEGHELLIGSVKTNIGHLEAAAGVAGLIKTALILFHKRLPPNLHFETPNPNIDFESLRLSVPTQTVCLEDSGALFAGVNSFGFGGANAHVVLAASSRSLGREKLTAHPFYPLVLPVSGQGLGALKARLGQFCDYLESGEVQASDLAASCALYADHLSNRVLVTGSDEGELFGGLKARLLSLETQAPTELTPIGAKGRMVFVFSGQGSKLEGMASGLLSYSKFRSVVARVDAVILGLGGWSVLEEMSADSQNSRLSRTEFGQPAIFALQVGLVEVLKEWGIQPLAVVGHSMGEVAAAVTAGVLSLEEGARLIFYRGQAMGATRPGRMMAVGLSEEKATELLRSISGVELAAVNGPMLCTVAGEVEAVEALASNLRDRGVFHRVLPINYAFHSELMTPVEERFRKALGRLKVEPARIPFVSTVTAGRIAGADFDLDYQWRNIRQPVRFASAVESLLADGFNIFVELGPDGALIRSLRDALDTHRVDGLAIGTLRRETKDSQALLEGIGQLYLHGYPLDWKALYGTGAPRVALPNYPWQRKPYWSESEKEHRLHHAAYRHPLLGWREGGHRQGWETELSLSRLPYLRDHLLDGQPVLPAAAMLEMALATSLDKDEPESRTGLVVELEGARFLSPIFLEEGRCRSLHSEFDEELSLFSLWSKESDTWTLHSRARVSRNVSGLAAPRIDLAAYRDRLTQSVDACTFYARLGQGSIQHSGCFRGVEWAWTDGIVALSKIVCPDDISRALSDYLFHPAQLDGAFQGISLLIGTRGGLELRALPVEVAHLTLYSRPSPTFYVLIERAHHERGLPCFDLTVCGEDGFVAARIQGFALSFIETFQESPYHCFEWIREELSPHPKPEIDNSWCLVGDIAGLSAELEERIRVAGGRIECHELEQSLSLSRLACIDRLVFMTSSSVPETLAELDGQLWDELDHLRRWLQDLLASQNSRARVWVVTEGFQANRALSASTLWGLTRVLASEAPFLQPTLLDLDDARNSLEREGLWRELCSESEEQEVALVAADRLVHRLLSIPEANLVRELATETTELPYALLQEKPGELDGLQPREMRPCELGEGEVRVQVAGAGLNFSDVLKALDLYPGTPGGALGMGLEFAGTVVECGPGATKFSPGDRVMGIAGGKGFATHLVADQRLLMRVPPQLSLSIAAGVPVPYITAYYALVSLADLKDGETVLVHSASGGVGLAALAIARRLGVKVIATAGSQAKREFLKARGVENVFDSRGLDFVAKVLEVTGGRGVDAVLNSLVGSQLRRGLECLAPGGRFLEIGKRDIYEDNPLPLGRFRNNLSFFAIDLEQLTREKPGLIQGMLSELSHFFESQETWDIPTTEFKMSQASAAFRLMSSAKHLGRIVLVPDEGKVMRLPDVSIPLELPSDGTFLVAGGLGGFGRELCLWLASRGARQIEILGRRQVKVESEPVLNELIERGVRVRYHSCDLADAEAVREVTAQCDRLVGIFHSAMDLDDCPFEQLTSERLWRVLRPKLHGAWNLHQASLASSELRYFVLFSSISALYGGPGQANYNAANVFLDQLARYRRRGGLPALSINWGAIGDVGYLADKDELKKHLSKAGVLTLESHRALDSLDLLLRGEHSQMAVARVDWQALRATLGGSRSILMSLAKSQGAGFDVAVAERLRRLAPAKRVQELVVLLAGRLSEILGVPPSELDTKRALTDYGLDSLMAFELRNWIQNSFQVVVPASVVLSVPTLRGLSEHLSAKLVSGEITELSAESPSVESGESPVGSPPTVSPEAVLDIVASPIAPQPSFDSEAWLESVPSYQLYRALSETSASLGLQSPFFRSHDGVTAGTSVLSGREMVNFTSYNYLGLCGHPEVDQAAMEAISCYGTSVSASRLVGGERLIHQRLEEAIADFLGTDSCLLMVSGHATNVSTISHLVGRGDLILYDAFSHDSAVQGAAASGATVKVFPHNDLDRLEALLEEHAENFPRLLVYTEGLYSMDGDIPDLPRFLALKERFGFLLMVDEAHSVGVLGRTGAGVAEYFGLPRRGQGVLWMGTLSKALASCGGFLAGDQVLIDFLRHSLPAFVYSVGMPAASAAASLKALEILRREPGRVRRLHDRAVFFATELKKRGIPAHTPPSIPIIPIVEGAEERCLRVCEDLFTHGVNVAPILYPAVPPGASRLRFFVTADHTEEQLKFSADRLAQAHRGVADSAELSTI